MGEFTLSYKTESYTCPFNPTTYPQTTYLPYDGCTGGSTATSAFQSLPSSPLATLQTYSLTTDSTQALNPLKLDHPVIIPLGYLLANDNVTVYLGVPNFDANAISLDQVTLRVHQGSVTATGTAPSSTTCSSTTKEVCQSGWTVSTTDNHFLSLEFANAAYITTFFEHLQVYAVSNVGASTGSVLAQYSTVYSQEQVKYFYLSQTSDFTASLETLSTGSFSSSETIQVYPVTLANANNIYTTGTAATVTTTTGTSPGIAIIKELASGYYFLRLTYTTSAASVTLKWITNAYTCPYHVDFADYMQHFQGCTGAVATTTPITTQQLPDAFSYDFTTTQSVANTLPFKYPIYSLGSIAAGKNIGIKLALVNTDANAAPLSSFTIKLIQTTPDGTATDLSSQCSSATSACSIPHAITATDNYYLAVYDANSADPFVKKYLQWFALEVIDDTSAATPNTLLKVSDVFRDRVVKYISITPAQATSFSLAPVSGGVTTNRDLELFAMSGSNNVFAVGTQQTMSSASVGSVQQYTTNSLNGFYMIAVKYDDVVSSATVVPKTFSYTCPYPAAYPDIHVNFPGCTANSAAATPSFLPFTSTSLTTTYTTDITVASLTLPFESPIFELGTLSSGDRLLLDVQVPSAGASAALIREFSIQLIRGSRRGSSQALSAQCSGVTYNCQIDQTISTGDTYFLGVSDPTGNFIFSYVQYFTIHAQKNSSGTVSTLFKYVDVYRNKVAKYFYSDGATAHTLSLSPVGDITSGTTVSADATNRFLTLYKTGGAPSEANSFSNTGSAITWASTSYDATTDIHTYVTPTLSQGFYVVISTFNDINNVTLSHSTLGYTCPYDASFTDIHQNFQGCTPNTFAVAGAPATTIDTQFRPTPCVETNSAGTCTRCVETYDLINGVCVFNVSCPNGQYFQFGTCVDLPPDANCATYDQFTGDCETCPEHYELQGVKCVFIPANCGARQWVNSDNQCVNVSDTCGDFNDTTGACLNCVSNLYEFNPVDGTCTRIVVTCGANQYAVGLECRDIPPECASFNVQFETCTECIPGYLPNALGVCERITCPDRQYPGPFGNCINVSPLCGEYDNITGQCITCREAGYVPTVDGCKQRTSPLASCRGRQALGFGKCTGAEVNCQDYNLITLECDECLVGFEKAYTGICQEKAVCGPQQWSVNGLCLNLPNNCVDGNDLGLCTECLPGYDVVQGQCVERKTCPEGYYLNDNDQCILADPACDKINPTSGRCITCVEPGTFPNLGVCCPSGQIYSAGSAQCVSV